MNRVRIFITVVSLSWVGLVFAQDAEIRAIDMQPSDVQTPELETPELEATELEATELEATEFEATEFEATGPETTDVETAEPEMTGEELSVPETAVAAEPAFAQATDGMDAEYDPENDPAYEDSEFGELLYNEASVSTRLEVLRLLSKETPSMLVFLQAVSMGLGIDDVLDAAVRYDPDRGRDFASAAVSILPLVTDSPSTVYSEYTLEDLERDDQTGTYLISDVRERFFEDRSVLVPYPDWIEGQFHFSASVAELKALVDQNDEIKWYRSRSSNANTQRPVFVSFYEHDKTLLVDGQARIEAALEANGEAARMPVVFVYNRIKERPIDQLDYPMTVRGIQQAYAQQGLMVTPAPEWETGEYHIFAQLEELNEIFDIPVEDDFEPEHWQRLLAEAEKYKVADTSLLAVILPSGEGDELSRVSIPDGTQYAQYDDPRSEQAFPYVAAGGERVSMKSVVSRGVIVNRPDLIAALNALGVTEVPMAFYYVDDARVKPYRKGPRGLIALAIGAGAPPGGSSGGGFGPPPEPPVCASPPCNN